MSTLVLILVAGLNFLIFDITYTRFVRRRLKSGDTRLKYVITIMIALLVFEGIYFYSRYGLTNTVGRYEITTVEEANESAESMNFEVTKYNETYEGK